MDLSLDEIIRRKKCMFCRVCNNSGDSGVVSFNRKPNGLSNGAGKHTNRKGQKNNYLNRKTLTKEELDKQLDTFKKEQEELFLSM